jgi:hypothetical protein
MMRVTSVLLAISLTLAPVIAMAQDTCNISVRSEPCSGYFVPSAQFSEMFLCISTCKTECDVRLKAASDMSLVRSSAWASKEAVYKGTITGLQDLLGRARELSKPPEPLLNTQTAFISGIVVGALLVVAVTYAVKPAVSNN